MFGASQGHAIAIFTHGWDKYVKYVMDKRQESEAQG